MNVRHRFEAAAKVPVVAPPLLEPRAEKVHNRAPRAYVTFTSSIDVSESLPPRSPHARTWACANVRDFYTKSKGEFSVKAIKY